MHTRYAVLEKTDGVTAAAVGTQGGSRGTWYGVTQQQQQGYGQDVVAGRYSQGEQQEERLNVHSFS